LKTRLTTDCEYAIYAATKAYGLGIYGGFEVTIGAGYGKERIDFVTMNSKEEFRCYEIKVSKSDFKSKAALSFLGDFNYYVMPNELYNEVKDRIPKEIGVYVVQHERNGVPYARLSKRPERNNNVDRVQLMHAMVRSLSRHETKLFLAKKNRYWESDELCGRG